MKKEKELRDDIDTMLTEWFEAQSDHICPDCSRNRHVADIGCCDCPVSYSLADCPNMAYDLAAEIAAIADRLISILPSPDDF